MRYNVGTALVTFASNAVWSTGATASHVSPPGLANWSTSPIAVLAVSAATVNSVLLAFNGCASTAAAASVITLTCPGNVHGTSGECNPFSCWAASAFAAWFGLLATALNLFPISQLDGGHIAYAVFGRRSTIITFVTIALAIGLTFVSSNWIVWTALMLAMMLVVGPHHPPTLDDDIRLGPGRLLVAAIALAMLIVCFTPAPISEFVATP